MLRIWRLLAVILVAVLANVAHGEEHWAWRALVTPEVPEAGESWARNPIDRFIAEKHEATGLTHAGEAERATLIRRLTYDLHGLPPTPEAISAFVNDNSPDAYEKLVDQLLASPRYGERWARHWLDIVHYGETHGFDKDQRRDNAWPYRDYVIKSLNEDKPYARFVEEQIAGDVLYKESTEAVIATGFIVAGPWDLVGQVEVRDGTVEKRRVRNLDRDNMITNVGGTFLSTTVHCARCHDHKFDPISQEDYYNLQAVFAGVDRGDRLYEEHTIAQKRNVLNARKKDLERERDRIQKSIDGAVPRRYHSLLKSIEALEEEVKKARATGSPTNGYHSVVSSVADATHWVEVDLGAAQAVEKIALIPARPTDFRDTPGFGFPIRFSVAVSGKATGDDWRVIVDYLDEDYPNPGNTPLDIALDDKSIQRIRVTATRLWERNNDYAFALAELEAFDAEGENLAAGKTVRASSSIDYGRWHTNNLVDGYDSRARRDHDPGSAPWAPLEQEIAEKKAKANELLTKHVDRETIQLHAATVASINNVAAEIAALPKPNKIWAVKPVDLRPVHVLHRGSVTSPKDLAKPAALGMVKGVEGALTIEVESEGHARAALAKWITRHDNGLTWRSIANRVWQYHFGVGLVTTPNDFGIAGLPPSHPELLDWLAATFRDNGGSLKSLHKNIVTSATYRQSSAHDAANAAIDGSNQYLWRANRRKLDAESIRDAMLLISGKMDFTMGGPSFKLFSYTHDHSPKYDYTGIDEPEVWRRSVYRYIVRSVPNPMLEALDCADPNINTPVRNQTLTALQALAMLNDAFVLQQSNYLAERMQENGDTVDAQIDFAMRAALGRQPTPEESARLAAFAQSQGLPSVARVIFNLNEFMFVD